MSARALALATLVLCGCGAATAGRSVVVSNEVSIAIVPAAPDMPFDPRSARLAQATRQLTSAAGHPIALQIDAALVPRYRSSLEEALAGAVEQIARDVTFLEGRGPAVFAREVPLLRRVECRYKATAERTSARFDAPSGTVAIDQSASSELVPEGAIARALEGEYGEWLDRTFANVAAESVPRDQWDAYFEWATTARPPSRAPGGRPPSQEEKFQADPRGTALIRVARFARVAGGGDGPLARRIDERLVSEMHYLLLAYESDAPLVRRSPPGSLFRQAEAAWVDWLKGRLPTLDDRSRLAVGDHLFDAARCGASCIPYRERFPGFDPFAFGLDVVDAWIRAGRPTQGADGDARFELMDHVVCPAMRRPDGRHERNRGCAGGWFELALADDATAGKLGAALGARGDALLVETLLFNLEYRDAAPVIALWRALAPYDALWQVAAREVTDELLDDVRKHTDLVAEAERVWAATPARRGAALYLMARADADLDPYYGDERWGTFDRRFGARIDQGVLAAMLDASPGAMKVARVVWPALGKGWSRAEIVVPRLDRFLDQPGVRAGEGGEPAKTVRALAKRMCADGGDADLGRLHAYLQRRAAAAHDGDPSIDPLVADTGRCAQDRKP